MTTLNRTFLFALFVALSAAPAALAQPATPPTTRAVATERKVVWDGDRTFPKAFGHVEPKEKNTFGPQTDEFHAGKVALEFAIAKASGAGANATATGGWNWHGWYPADSGEDLSAYTHLVFWMRVEKGKQVDAMKIGLESSVPAGSSARVDLAKYCANAFDGEWREVAIPAADLIVEGGKFNPKKAWELHVEVRTDSSQVPYSVFFDDIAFEKR